jgi:antitoxin VapB
VAINIKNREAEALLCEIKAATGKGATEIVLGLARAEAERLRKQRDVERRRRLIDEASERYAARLGPDRPSLDELVGYGEDGLPR